LLFCRSTSGDGRGPLSDRTAPFSPDDELCAPTDIADSFDLSDGVAGMFDGDGVNPPLDDDHAEIVAEFDRLVFPVKLDLDEYEDGGGDLALRNCRGCFRNVSPAPVRPRLCDGLGEPFGGEASASGCDTPDTDRAFGVDALRNTARR